MKMNLSHMNILSGETGRFSGYYVYFYFFSTVCPVAQGG